MKSLLRNVTAPLALLLAVATPASLAQDDTSLSSDWMELVKGQKSESMGVELRDIQPGAEAGTQTVTFAVPKSSVRDPDDIEEVIVVGRKPDSVELPKLNIQYKWLRDYDNDNYGLVITLGEGNWPIRLFMNSRPGYVN
ncbi:hypothetical protein E4634_09985 [Mangrovimicrobium sediminis]|uniref:Uncharacterized protein n=1 Tax=Mangrovimicrobium sediminis TaxID=2562682 RepID=A0A4Z0M247_9GAMM|nr:hypothetical protein [Haliea sp. SAOS-164]TGD73355.1 hypothetical protein E4634_09985 [Haliea sp. SAOS-164]